MIKFSCDFCGADVDNKSEGAGTLAYVKKTSEGLAPSENIICDKCLKKALDAMSSPIEV